MPDTAESVRTRSVGWPESCQPASEEGDSARKPASHVAAGEETAPIPDSISHGLAEPVHSGSGAGMENAMWVAIAFLIVLLVVAGIIVRIALAPTAKMKKHRSADPGQMPPDDSGATHSRSEEDIRPFSDSSLDEELLQHVARIAGAAEAARKDVGQTVVDFKNSLNKTMGEMGKFMEKVLRDSEESRRHALETKDFSKQVSSLIQAKEDEITKLKEGYHIQIIAPLIKTFLGIRDDLCRMADRSSDTQATEQLRDLDRRIGEALSELQIAEIPVPDRPHEELHSRYWVSLGAPEPTDDPSRHGAVARVQERGYLLRREGGEHHVIRKAVVVIQCFSDASAHPRHPSSTDS